jgi:methylmalonyl-CoA epimerase
VLNIYRIDHIGQVVPEIGPMAELLEKAFGLRRLRSWESPAEGCRGVLYEIPGSPEHRWEVLEPLGEDSPLRGFLDGPRGPGIHHVAVEVTDLDAALAALETEGIRPLAESADGSRSWVDASVSPPAGGEGITYRLYGPPTIATCGAEGPIGVSDGENRGGDGPTLGLTGLVHICQAYPDRDELMRWHEEVTGFREVYRTPEGEWPDMATMVLNIPGSRASWEVIQPVGEDSFIERYLEGRGPGCHHVTLEVADWKRALAACEHHEVPTFGESQGETDGARWADVFIHPKHAGGVLVQLYWEESPGVWIRSDKIPRKKLNDPWT